MLTIRIPPNIFNPSPCGGNVAPKPVKKLNSKFR